MLTKESAALVSEITQEQLGTKKPEKAKWHALIAAWLGEAFDAMDASLYFIALVPAISELIRSKSDVEVGQIGSLVLAIFMVGWFFGAIGFGVVADRIGRRKTMMLTILIYSVATGMCALAHTWQELAVCRFLVGLGIGGEICLGGVVISEFWSKRSRLWAACALESSFNFGLMLSAGANAVLGPYGWRWLFLAGVIPALLTLYIRSNMKESEPFTKVKAKRDQLKNKKKEDLEHHEKKFLRSPLEELIKGEARGRLLVTALLGTSAVIGYWACVAWIPAWVNQLTGGLAVAERSTATTVFSVGGLVGCFATPLIINRLGRANTFKLAFGGGLLATLGMFLLVKSYGTPLMVWCFVAGILINMQWAGLQIYIPEAFKTNVLATATGVCFGAGRIFAAVLAVCGGQLIAIYDGSYAYASATLGLVYGIGFVASFWLYETSGEVAGADVGEEETEQAMPARALAGA
jgi:MFS family permease